VLKFKEPIQINFGTLTLSSPFARERVLYSSLAVNPINIEILSGLS